ncbi:predicted protein [Lichtheimia corymbifera JMRC:FSU:9682]|uniref:Uncharacterized protein n=1 Tax=Lichtheimia corymbifera JMRC:FSU:9682 TaxID=1263082 RepID=A0A068SFI4_9FUNG|nr:predicted protein [Lichtheimia corymbifera JMRC:FSU:9682]
MWEATMSIQVHQYLRKHGLARDRFDGLVKILNGFLGKNAPNTSPLLSHHRSRTHALKTYPVSQQLYGVCPKGCKLYVEGDDTEQCTLRQGPPTPGYREDGKPIMQMTYLPLIEQPSLMIYDPEVRYQQRSPWKTGSSVYMDDIFDGELMQEQRLCGDMREYDGLQIMLDQSPFSRIHSQ